MGDFGFLFQAGITEIARKIKNFVTFRPLLRLIYSKVKGGDYKLDYEQLYKAYYMQVYSYIITMTKDPTEAEEITQKAFFKAFLSKSKYRGDSSPFTWLCAIAKNIFMDKKRVEKRQADTFENSLEETPSDDSLEKNFEDKEQVFRIHQILHQMDEPYNL